MIFGLRLGLGFDLGFGFNRGVDFAMKIFSLAVPAVGGILQGVRTGFKVYPAQNLTAASMLPSWNAAPSARRWGFGGTRLEIAVGVT